MSDVTIGTGLDSNQIVYVKKEADLSDIQSAKTDTLTYKNQAATSATNAGTSEVNANISATEALGYKNEVEALSTSITNNVNSAATSANNASSYSSSASISATNASGSATEASGHVTTASGSAATATTQAGLASQSAIEATTQANIATTKASEALTWRNEAQVDRIATGDMLTEFQHLYWGSLPVEPENQYVTDGDLYQNGNTGDLMIRRNGLWGEAILDQTNVYSKGEVNDLLAQQDQAVEITYNNTTSGLVAVNVKDALDELTSTRYTKTETDTLLSQQDDAIEIAYDNTGRVYISGSEVQTAINDVDIELVNQASRLTTNESSITTNADNIQNINDSIGVANGIASLDANTLIPSSQLPSYVDDTIEVATYSALPATGETGKIYIVVADETSNGDTSSYRWTGSIYALVSNTLNGADVKALYEGEADTNAYTDNEKTFTDIGTSLNTAATTLPTAVNEVKTQIEQIIEW